MSWQGGRFALITNSHKPMESMPMPEAIREVVAAFHDTKALDDAVYALETRGFDRAAFSLLASEQAVEEKLGHRYQNVKEVEDDPSVPRATFFSRISRLEADYLPTPL